MKGPLFPGTCRFCGCTEAEACRVPPYGAEDACSWLHGTVPVRTVCTAPECMRRWMRIQLEIRRRDDRRRNRFYRRQAMR